MARPSFAEFVAQRRAALGLTQQDVADRMAAGGSEVSHQTVWKWEAGETRPRRDRLEALAAALTVTTETALAWWLGAEVGSSAPVPISSRWQGLLDDLSPDAVAAIDRIIKLDRAARRDLRRTRRDDPGNPHPRLDIEGL